MTTEPSKQNQPHQTQPKKPNRQIQIYLTKPTQIKPTNQIYPTKPPNLLNHTFQSKLTKLDLPKFQTKPNEANLPKPNLRNWDYRTYQFEF